MDAVLTAVDTRHWERMAPYLAALGCAPSRVQAYRVLSAGTSGAATYRIYTRDGHAVLKLTPAGSGRLPTERALRELAFYRELAAHVPLQVPRLLAWQHDDAAYALLLAAYRPAPPPVAWPAADYLEAAAQLARLHAAYWDQPDALARYPWLARREPAGDTANLVRAEGYWRALHGRPALVGVLDAAELAWIRRLLAGMPAVRATIDVLPVALCHGDTNPGNVLRDDAGALVWTDWQEAGVGRGPEDLAFLLQQAAINGGRVPVEAALAAYHAALVAATGTSIPLGTIRRVVEAAELWSRVLYWPAYMAGVPADDLAAMLRRIHHLAAGLAVAA